MFDVKLKYSSLHLDQHTLRSFYLKEARPPLNGAKSEISYFLLL